MEQRKIGGGDSTYTGFGNCISLSKDGNTALIGANKAAFIVEKGSAWGNNAKVMIGVSTDSSYGTYSVFLSYYGTLALISNVQYLFNTSTGKSQGAVYAINKGTGWTTGTTEGTLLLTGQTATTGLGYYMTMDKNSTVLAVKGEPSIFIYQ